MGDRAGTFLQLESTALTLEDIFAPDPEAGTAKRVKGDLVIRGSQFSYKSCKQAMVIVLRELAGLDSDLLQRCAQDPVLCQNSALLKQTINQQRSVCVCDRTKGRRLYDRLVSKNTNKLKTRNSKNL